jgi:hypothetical protein
VVSRHPLPNVQHTTGCRTENRDQSTFCNALYRSGFASLHFLDAPVREQRSLTKIVSAASSKLSATSVAGSGLLRIRIVCSAI